MVLNLYTPNTVSKKFYLLTIGWLVIASIILIIVCAELFGNKSRYTTSKSGIETATFPSTSTKSSSATTELSSATTGSSYATTESSSATNSTYSTTHSTPTSGSTDVIIVGDCEIFPMSLNSPLLIIPDTTTLIYPEPGTNTTKFSGNQSVDLACPNGTIRIGQNQFGPITTAVCRHGEKFDINGTIYEWKNITCANFLPTVIESSLQELDETDPIRSCLENSNTTVVANIGFRLDDNRFLRLVKICFNTTSKIALYSQYNISASISNRAVNVSNPAYRQDDIFYRMGRSVQDIYRNNQTTINTILLLDNNSSEYINNEHFINRGHLAAKADFMHSILQVAVYRYVNVAPQWSSFNGGNWNQAENDVRYLADRNKTDLQIWTGTYGVATLESKEVYLYVDANDRRNSPGFPVPAIFWKLVYDPSDMSGIVLVGHNNPYENVTEKYCDEDVSGEVDWLRWGKYKNDTRKGYSYACNYNDAKFQSVVSFVPKIEVRKLLV